MVQRRKRVLVACEFSGVVRDAFARRGWDAWSCDLLPSERPGKHFQGDVLGVLSSLAWDLVIAHPPCTYLALSGNRWFKCDSTRKARAEEAAAFVLRIVNGCTCPLVIEQPMSRLSSLWRKRDQTIHPWQFGHPERKTTWLWLRGVPPLKPTNVVEPLLSTVHRMPPSPERAKARSRTFAGVAEAMADQWGSFLCNF